MSIRFIFALGSLAVVLVLAAVGVTLGEVTAVKGSYVLVGLLLGGALYGATTRANDSERPRTPARWLGKGVYVLVLAAISWTALTDERLFALLVCLPVGYALVALQLSKTTSPRWILPQITALFAVGPLTKYLATGFYFGDGDTLRHVGHVEALTRTGTTDVLARYELFPGFHVLTGTVDMVTGLSPYDSLLLVGIVTYAALVPLTYLLAAAVTGDARLALFVAIGFAALEPVAYFSTYFFPQSLAVVLLLFVVYLSYRSRSLSVSDPTQFLLLIPIVAAAIVTHHFTFIMFAPILGLVLLAPAVLKRIDATRQSGKDIYGPRVGFLVIAWGGAVAYWWYARQFVVELLFSIQTALSNSLLAGDFGKPAAFYTYGFTLDEPNVWSALLSLASPTGVYVVVLVAVIATSFAALTRLQGRRSVRRSGAVLLAAFAFTPFLLPTPIVIPGTGRLQLILAVFFAFVVGLSLYALGTSTPESGTSTTVLVVVVVLLGTSGAIVAADDVRTLQTGPDLTNIHPSPGPQVAFSNGEYAQLEQTSDFVQRHDSSPSSMWISRWTLQRFGAEATERPAITQRGIGVNEGTFMYRDQWSCHEVLEVSEGGLTYTSMLFSETSLEDTVRAENKIYSSGETGLIWLESESVLFDEGDRRARSVAAATADNC